MLPGGKQLTMSSFLKPKAEVKVTEENWLDSLVASRKNKDEVDAESEDVVLGGCHCLMMGCCVVWLGVEASDT